MTETIRTNMAAWLSAANIVLLLGIVWNTSAWKAEVDSQILQHREQIAYLASRQIHPQADRRLVSLEREVESRARELQSLKEDLVRRLDRIDNKIDKIAENQ